MPRKNTAPHPVYLISPRTDESTICYVSSVPGFMVTWTRTKRALRSLMATNFQLGLRSLREKRTPIIQVSRPTVKQQDITKCYAIVMQIFSLAK